MTCLLFVCFSVWWPVSKVAPSVPSLLAFTPLYALPPNVVPGLVCVNNRIQKKWYVILRWCCKGLWLPPWALSLFLNHLLWGNDIMRTLVWHMERYMWQGTKVVRQQPGTGVIPEVDLPAPRACRPGQQPNCNLKRSFEFGTTQLNVSWILNSQ